MQLAIAAMAAVRDHFSPSGVILYRLCRKFVQARRLIRFGDWRKDEIARPRFRANRFSSFFPRFCRFVQDVAVFLSPLAFSRLYIISNGGIEKCFITYIIV